MSLSVLNLFNKYSDILYHIFRDMVPELKSLHEIKIFDNLILSIYVSEKMWLKMDTCMYFYYIPTNVISLDTVDFTECDPMLRITTL